MSINEELIILIEAFTLENSLKFNGKPSLDSIVKRVISYNPGYRNIIRELIPIIKDICNRVSSMPISEQEGRFRDIKHVLPEHKKVEKAIEGLPPIPNATKGEVVTRFAPNPDFVLHLGSLRPLILSYEYAKMYDGEFILRFEDTDPRIKRPEKEYYELILDDLEWLGTKPDKIYYQSERLELYYSVARDLLEMGKAYVCTCERGVFQELVRRGISCPDRGNSVDKNIELFDRMLEGYYGEGETVLRIKTDMRHPNPSIRDWAALRIIDTSRYPHPRVGDKYIVWPLYNFAVSVDDHYMGITHIFRGEEHRVNEEKQRYIYKYMGWEPPHAIHHGRLAITDGILSKSAILKGIQEDIYTGYDDLRLYTIPALRRRGITAKALKNIIMKVGIKKSTAVIDWSLIAAENRSIIDPLSNRYYGIREPRKIHVDGYPTQTIRIRLHPDDPSKGFRVFKLPKEGVDIYIENRDMDKYLKAGSIIRLLNLGNYLFDNGRLKFMDNDVGRAVKERYPMIHWVPVNYALNAEMYFPDKIVEGVVEKNILRERAGNWIQLERIGYFRIEALSGTLIKLVYTHNH